MDEPREWRWDWDTISARLLAGIFVMEYRELRHWACSDEEQEQLSILRSQAMNLLDKTRPKTPRK